ncbi:YpdA family putative bacillithiol disulfide reductase [Cohnella zeiphila]|uniref:YpdA family putative bacillithiol disulfide reductase n=1 Tax=Cohnella zeiphila TaxID=2761120 RepID=A0A7X0SQ44_9BACL|nr:YpdA family putative bacillithiol disulfide reductase [Cohnella zeiphila]MBB6732989.1 YpdA family putative bacillithiol disulfide reductase [Cohnella zeiphila]
MEKEQVVVVGAGPCGLSAAAELQDQGFDPLIIEKENVAYSISQYPVHMLFFSSAENLEIAGIPFVTPNDKPSRLEALNYYRIVSERRQLRIRRFEKVTSVERTEDGAFRVSSVNRAGETLTTTAGAVVVATGYFDHPNRIGIPGEELPHVSHFFREAHPYAGTKVVIIGGSNSAVDAALELVHVGARVTIVYRGESVSDNVKPWVRPLLLSSVSKGRIDLLTRSRVVEIEYGRVIVRSEEQEPAGEPILRTVEADFVLALTGFRPDRGFLRAMGVEAPDGEIPPTHDPETMETNVPGLYLAGVVSTGRDANEIFIESGRYHGTKIAAHLAASRNGA